ncbi:MAG: ATP-binding domain-containing protein, partial [Acidimicrobiales bacterium]
AGVRDVTGWSSVGVIVPAGHVETVEAALRVAGVPYGDAQRGGLREAVTVVLPPEAKGLEFDAVVVVEPAGFLADEGRDDERLGARLLYIALTRAVQVLVIVHTQPLPEALAIPTTP